MAAPLKVPLPPDLTLTGDYVLRFDALDPTTGAAVAGVRVSAVSLFGRVLAGDTSGDVPLPALVPSEQLV